MAELSREQIEWIAAITDLDAASIAASAGQSAMASGDYGGPPNANPAVDGPRAPQPPPADENGAPVPAAGDADEPTFGGGRYRRKAAGTKFSDMLSANPHVHAFIDNLRKAAGRWPDDRDVQAAKAELSKKYTAILAPMHKFMTEALDAKIKLEQRRNTPEGMMSARAAKLLNSRDDVDDALGALAELLLEAQASHNKLKSATAQGRKDGNFLPAWSDCIQVFLNLDEATECAAHAEHILSAGSVALETLLTTVKSTCIDIISALDGQLEARIVARLAFVLLSVALNVPEKLANGEPINPLTISIETIVNVLFKMYSATGAKVVNAKLLDMLKTTKLGEQIARNPALAANIIKFVNDDIAAALKPTVQATIDLLRQKKVSFKGYCLKVLHDVLLKSFANVAIKFNFANGNAPPWTGIMKPGDLK